MAINQGRLMTKSEIAELLGVSIDDIQRWAQRFADWLDICPRWRDRTHDKHDIQIFTFISEIDRQLGDNVPFQQHMSSMERELKSSRMARDIRQKRIMEKRCWEVTRWQEVSPTMGACLRYEYEWLKPLRPYVESIANFGCSARKMETCAEPYALLWTLEATRIVVIDKNPEHILDAQKWRERHPDFKDYPLEFVVGDMTDEIDALDEGAFDLSYCKDVLYNMHPNSKELQDSINMMARVVKPDGWVIAREPVDIRHVFEAAGLARVCLDNAPDWSYCYKKPSG